MNPWDFFFKVRITEKLFPGEGEKKKKRIVDPFQNRTSFKNLVSKKWDFQGGRKFGGAAI